MSTSNQLTTTGQRAIAANIEAVPALIADAGGEAAYSFLKFFTAGINNDNTRAAYLRAVRQFAQWCEQHRYSLHHVEPIRIAAYIKQLQRIKSRATVKQHLSAIRMLFDWFVREDQIVRHNPATSVRGPKHIVKKGMTPVLIADEARRLLDTIAIGTDDAPNIAGLRDRALIGVMVYSFARISAALAMNVGDYDHHGKRSWLRLHEKGGKHHEVPAHHNAQLYLDAYLLHTGIAAATGTPLFRALDTRRQLTEGRLHRRNALYMIKRRARKAELSPTVSCHTFRATGITAYLENGGTIEQAQQIAAHESPRTTKLYDHTSDQLTLDEIERIVI